MPPIEVPADAAGERLDVFLAGHAGSRAAAQRLIDDGRVRVDGEEKVKRHTLRGGETIEVEEAEAEVARDVPDARFSIAWEDEHLMVVDKPAGVVVHPARGHAAGTLAQALERVGAAGGPEGRRGIVHRLDRDTSGLLVVARSDEVLKALQSALRRREIVREYLALVEGRPDARTGTIEAPLGRDRRVRTRMSTDTAEGRAAITHFETERVLRRLHAAARAARDRPHAPDPRPPEGDRPPRGRRPRVRPRRRPRARAPVPARRAARVRAPGHGRAHRRPLPAPRRPRPRPLTRRGGHPGRPTRGIARTGPPEVGEGRAGPHSSETRGPRANLRKLIACNFRPPTRAIPQWELGDGGPARRSRRVRPPPDTARRRSKSTFQGSTPMAEVGIRELLESGVHFGHQTRRWNPKMRRFIHGERGGIYIIDLLKTQALLEQAQQFSSEVAHRGGTVLFVGTKKQARDSIKEVAENAGMPFVNHRWLGGLLTNFQTISLRIKRLHDLERYESEGQLALLPTRERMAAQADLAKLQANLGGVKNMQRPPDAMFVVDLKTEVIAVQEAKRLRIPIIGLVDTNCDPDGIDYVIPGNDDAIKSCAIITQAIGDVVSQGYQTFRAEEERARKEAEEQARKEAEERAAREEEERQRKEAEEAAARQAERDAAAAAEAQAPAAAAPRGRRPRRPSRRPRRPHRAGRGGCARRGRAAPPRPRRRAPGPG